MKTHIFQCLWALLIDLQWVIEVKTEGSVVIMSYDDSVYSDNAAWDESQIMMYIKLHRFHFSAPVPHPPARPAPRPLPA